MFQTKKLVFLYITTTSSMLKAENYSIFLPISRVLRNSLILKIQLYYQLLTCKIHFHCYTERYQSMQIDWLKYVSKHVSMKIYVHKNYKKSPQSHI